MRERIARDSILGMARMVLLTFGVCSLVLAGELGRIVLAVASAGVIYLAFRIGYDNGAEEREAAIVVLITPFE